jgi:hypothetical protein
MTEAFEQFAIVELFGHNVIAGKVSEQVIGGQGFVRVDVPATQDQSGFTKFFGPGAIYAITPCDEGTMLSAVAGLRQKPIDVWKLNLPQLEAASRSEEDETNDPDPF